MAIVGLVLSILGTSLTLLGLIRSLWIANGWTLALQDWLAPNKNVAIGAHSHIEATLTADIVVKLPDMDAMTTAAALDRLRIGVDDANLAIAHLQRDLAASVRTLKDLTAQAAARIDPAIGAAMQESEGRRREQLAEQSVVAILGGVLVVAGQITTFLA